MEVNVMSGPVQSPCVRNCCLDDHDICMGCGRHLTEITGWQAMDEENKARVVLQAKDRLQQRQRT